MTTPATTPAPQKITPDCQPPIPCWVWHSALERWQRIDPTNPLALNGCFDTHTHWLPDGPKPTCTPTEGEKDLAQLRIVAAAVIHGGVVHTAPHHHLAMWQISCCWGEKAHGDQGFVASDGKFYDRVAAKRIARDAGQIKFPLAHEPEELFSEELWSYSDWCHERGMNADGVTPHPTHSAQEAAERAANIEPDFEFEAQFGSQAEIDAYAKGFDDAKEKFARHFPSTPTVIPSVLGHPATAEWCKAVDEHHTATEQLLREAQSQQPPENEPASCKDADGCPVEMAVLKRFWREHQQPLSPGSGEARFAIGRAIKKHIDEIRDTKDMRVSLPVTLRDSIFEAITPFLAKPNEDICKDEQYIPRGHHIVEDADGERFVKNALAQPATPPLPSGEAELILSDLRYVFAWLADLCLTIETTYEYQDLEALQRLSAVAHRTTLAHRHKYSLKTRGEVEKGIPDPAYDNPPAVACRNVERPEIVGLLQINQRLRQELADAKTELTRLAPPLPSIGDGKDGGTLVALANLLDNSAVISPPDQDPCFVDLQVRTEDYEAAYAALSAQSPQSGREEK